MPPLHPLDQLAQQRTTPLGTNGDLPGAYPPENRGRMQVLDAMSQGQEPTFDSLYASLGQGEQSIPDDESMLRFLADNLPAEKSPTIEAPTPSPEIPARAPVAAPAAEPEDDGMAAFLAENLPDQQQPQAGYPAAEHPAAEHDPYEDPLAGEFPPYSGMVRVPKVAPPDTEAMQRLDDFYATIEAASIEQSAAPKTVPGHLWDAAKRVFAPFARVPAELESHLKRLRGIPQLSELAEQTVEAETAFRVSLGLYSQDQHPSREDVNLDSYIPPPFYDPSTLKSAMAIGKAGGEPFAPFVSGTADIANRVREDLGKGFPMLSPEAIKLQERYYREAAKMNPLGLSKADNILEHAADFIGEIGRFVTEIGLFRKITAPGLAKLAPELGEGAQKFLSTSAAAGMSGALQDPESPLVGAAHSAAFLAIFQALGGAGKAIGGKPGQIAAEMMTFGGAEAVAGQPIERVLVATALGPLVFRLPVMAESGMRSLRKLRETKVSPETSHDAAAERLFVRVVRLMTEKDEPTNEDLMSIRAEAGGIDVEKLSEPYRLAFETFVQDNLASGTEAAIEAGRPVEEPSPRHIIPESIDAIAEGLKQRSDQGEPRSAGEGGEVRPASVGYSVQQSRKGTAEPPRPAAEEVPQPARPEPTKEVGPLPTEAPKEAGPLFEAAKEMAEPVDEATARIQRFRETAMRRREGTKREPPDHDKADMLDAFADAAENDILPAILRRISNPTQALDIMRDIEGDQKSRVNRRASLERAGITPENIGAARRAMADVTEAARRVAAQPEPKVEVPYAQRLAEADEALTAAGNAVKKHERQHRYDRKPHRIKDRESLAAMKMADTVYQGLLEAQLKAQRTVSGLLAVQTKAINADVRTQALEEIAQGRVDESSIKYAPIADLPELVRGAIQQEARGLLETAKPGSATATALQKIIDGTGDVGADVRDQKQRIVERLRAIRDDRTLPDRQRGVPEREVDPIVETMLSPDRVAMATEAIRSIDAGEENKLASEIEERLLFSDPDTNPLSEFTDYRSQARAFFVDVLRAAGAEPPGPAEAGIGGETPPTSPATEPGGPLGPPEAAEGLKTPPAEGRPEGEAPKGVFGQEVVPEQKLTTEQRPLEFTHDIDGNLVTKGGTITPDGRFHPDMSSKAAKAEAERIEREVDQGQMLLGQEPPKAGEKRTREEIRKDLGLDEPPTEVEKRVQAKYAEFREKAGREPDESERFQLAMNTPIDEILGRSKPERPEGMSDAEWDALQRLDPDDPGFGMGAMFNYPRAEQSAIRAMYKQARGYLLDRWKAGYDWMGNKIKGADPASRQRRFADWLGAGLWRQMYGLNTEQQKAMRRVEGGRAEGVVRSRAVLEPLYSDVARAGRLAGKTKGEVTYQNAIREAALGERPVDSLTKDQRQHYERYKSIIDALTDRLLSIVEHEPWFGKILKSYGVENIVDVIKGRRERGLPYLRVRYRVPQVVEDAARRQGGPVLLGPRLATSMFRPRGTGLFRVELAGEKGEGKHTWEFYDWDEAAQKFMELRGLHDPKRIKMKTPFEQDVIAELEPVTDVGYLMMRSITDTLQNITVLQLMKTIEPVAIDAVPEADGKVKVPPGYSQIPVPNLSVFGPLAGKYLPRSIARTFSETVDAGSNEWVDLGRLLLYGWKFSKTVVNPSTNARNWYGNRIFMYLAGVSPERHPLVFIEAWREVWRAETQNDLSETDYMNMVREGKMTLTFAQEAAAPLTEKIGARGMTVGFLEQQADTLVKGPNEQTPFERLRVMAKYLENRRQMSARAALRHLDGDIADDNTFIDAAKHLIDRTPEYKRLARKGLLSTDHPVGAMQTLARVLSKDTAKRDQAIARIMDESQKAGRVYDFSDKVSKLFVYKVARLQGATHEEALRRADYLPNYAMLGTFAQALRRRWFGAPFVSFVDHSVKASFQAGRDAPMRLATLYSLPAGLTAMTMALYGLSFEDVQDIWEAKGIRGVTERYFQPLIPWVVDGRDAPATLDLRWIWPLANDFRVSTGMGGIGLPIVFGMPHVNFFVNLGYRFNIATGQPVFQEDDPMPVKIAKSFWSNLVPLPGALNYGAYQAYRSVIGESERSLISVFLQHTLGIRISPAQASRRGALDMLKKHGKAKDAARLFRALDLYNTVLRRKDGKAILLSDLRRSLEAPAE